MSVGKLRHRVTIQAENSQPDGAGGFTDPWASPTNVATVWAEVQPIRGSEKFHAMQLEDKVTHRVRIRYRSGITAKHRLLFEGRAMNIRSVIDPDERSRWLVIMATEGDAV